MKLRVGDTVIVIAGSEKGKTGKILKINHKTNRIIVEDVNKVTKHVKPSQSDPDGGIITVEAGIDVSNLAYYDSKLKRGVKLGYRCEDGKKVRFNKKTGETIKEQKR